eukprot:scaffold9879_cov76-Cyclotella_meneghiniana.AAC.7
MLLLLHSIVSHIIIIASSCARADRYYMQPKAYSYASHHHTRSESFLDRRLLRLRGGENDVTTASTNQLASPAAKSPYEYVPVTALDDYGQSTQLRHAMESAKRYGTPVLACLCCTGNESPKEDAILICSLQRPRLGVIASSYEPNGIVTKEKVKDKNIHSSIQGLVRVLTTRDDSNTVAPIPRHSLHTALVATGLQADASFLINKLQTHAISKYWFRYDVLPRGEMILRMVREILLDFLGYDWREEMGSSSSSGGIGSAAPSYNDDEEESTRAGRPLGVCTFLLELDSSNFEESPSLTVIKANGSSERYAAHAMGVGSDLGNKRLCQKWRKSISDVCAKEMMRTILKEIAVEKGWLPEENRDKKDYATENESYESLGESYGSDLTIVCETVTRDGIAVDYFNL